MPTRSLLAVTIALIACPVSPIFADGLGNPDTNGLPPRTTIAYPPARPIPQWLQTHLRIGHLPPYDERMVDEFLKAGYNVVTVNCLTHWDRVGPSASLYTDEEVKRSDAYLRKIVNQIHAASAKSVWYIGPVQVPWLSKEFCKAHPDWLRINPDGKPDKEPNFANIRSGYADWLCRQLAYVTKEYGVDGFWLDGYAPGQLQTFDENTRKLFREHSGGHDIPAKLDDLSDPVVRQYLTWHEQYFVDLGERMRAAVREQNPEAILFANNSGCRTWYIPGMTRTEYPASYSGAIDVSAVELYWDVPGDALYQQFVYAHIQGVTRDRGSSVWIQPSEHGVSGISSPVEIQLRGLEGAPWGVSAEYVESAGREEYLKLHVANIKAREQWLARSEAVPYIGIVASEQTRAFHAQAALPVYFSHTLGAFRAIFEKHWPVRVLTEYDLEDADLQGVRVLVLPDVTCLSARAAEVIRRFVRNGGGLVATFETSLHEADFNRRSDFALADVFHAHYVKTHVVDTRDHNLTLTLAGKHPITDDPAIAAKQNTAWRGGKQPPPEAGPLALIASATEVTIDESAEVLATYQTNPPEPQAKPCPAIVASRYGQGRVVYFPAGVDQGMFFYPDGYMRQLLANACLWAAGALPFTARPGATQPSPTEAGANLAGLPPLEVEGPLLLSATFRRQPREHRLIVHLLNDHSSYGRHSIAQHPEPVPTDLRKKFGLSENAELRATWPIREEIIPLHDIKVRCRLPGVTRATLQPDGIDLPLTRTPQGVEVTVPKLTMHAMVVFEQADK